MVVALTAFVEVACIEIQAAWIGAERDGTVLGDEAHSSLAIELTAVLPRHDTQSSIRPCWKLASFGDGQSDGWQSNDRGA